MKKQHISTIRMKQCLLAISWHKLTIITLLISFPLYCTQSTHYIKPTADTPCPGEPCHTLSQYGEEYFHNINLNATLEFLPGDHTLNFTISLGTLSNSWDNSQPGDYYPSSSLTLLGSPAFLPEITSRIVCTWPAGFLFSGITEVHVTALTFFSCGHNDSAALKILAVGKTNITKSTFLNNKNSRSGSSEEGFGGAIYVHSSNITFAENIFQHNIADNGGAIEISSNNEVTFSRNTFYNNSAYYFGGALYANTKTKLTLLENTFQNNSAESSGGALFAYTNNAITLSENRFQNNLAKNGGTLFVYSENTLTLSKNTIRGNFAEYGGAVYAETNNTLIFSGDTFQNNFAGYGGALYTGRNNTLTISKNTFQNNSALSNGGALTTYTHNTLTLSDNTFINNSAGAGGAVFVYSYSTLTLSNNIIQNNSVRNAGGALYVYTNNLLIISVNTFQNNFANYLGGTLAAMLNTYLTLSGNTFKNNYAGNAGGSIFLNTSNIFSLSENTFQRNCAEYYGGALYADENNTLTLSGNTFQNNCASSTGGVITAFTNNTLILSGNTLMNNFAGTSGGALFSHSNSTLTLSDNTIQNNSASNAGGALFSYSYSTLILAGNTIQNNSAGNAGGALYSYTNIVFTLLENIFQNNSAGNAGGVLLANTSNTFTLLENIFQNNSAGNAGGALFANKSNIFALSENTFQKNSAEYSGGALYGDRNNTFELSENTFLNNSALSTGGTLTAFTNNTLTLSENTFMNNFVGSAGGVLFSHSYSTLILSDNTFQNNSAGSAGGTLYVYTNNTLIISGNTFQNNSAGYSGGALAAMINNHLTFSENTFQKNYAGNAGGALFANTSNTFFLSENTFQMSSAEFGGALTAYGNNTLTLSKNTFQNNSAGNAGGVLIAYYKYNILTLSENTFQSNSAVYGGALVARESTVNLTNNTLFGNIAELNGGAILCFSNCTLLVHGSHIVRNNIAQRGGAIAALGCKVVLTGDAILENNTAYYGGGLYAQQAEIGGNAYLIKNFARRSGGGVYASRSVLYFKSTFRFDENLALNGGGLLFADGSRFYLWPKTTVHFTKNSAQQKGGAIKVTRNNPLSHCVEESCNFLTGSDCFFQVQTERHYNFTTIVQEIAELKNIRLYFQNNTAHEAGAMLYGGSVDNCSLSLINPQLVGYLEPYKCSSSGEVFDYISTLYEQFQDISSDPLYICSCVDGEPDCSASSISRLVYPGGTIKITTIAYGQRNGTTPAVVYMITPGEEITTKESEKTQGITKSCTSLNYTVQTRTEGSNYEMMLYVGSCPPNERTELSGPTNVITVHVTILDCPHGFELSGYEPLCNCAQRLQQYTNTCKIADRTIERATHHEFWVGYKEDNTSSDGLILHRHCPFDYCTSNELYLAVDDSDKQCVANRTGLLCGKCTPNFSLALGTNRCLQCSSNYLWLIAAFAFAGVALVLVLLVLRLTVAVGTINGLIFYANVFSMNSATFFSPHTNVLTVFIAWLNLDLGIETCFYDGMDAYAKAWLQFVFPIYVWALVGIIILISHYSSKVATFLELIQPQFSQHSFCYHTVSFSGQSLQLFLSLSWNIQTTQKLLYGSTMEILDISAKTTLF